MSESNKQNEQIRYGAREPDGTRTVIVEDAGQDTRTVAELRAEVERLKERLLIESHEAAAQNARGNHLEKRAEAAEAELNRLRNQLRIEYPRNEAPARIRDAVGRIAQVFGDDVYRMPIDSEIGCVQWVLNRYKELEARTTAEISEADRVAGKTMIGGGELPPWTADAKEAT